MAEWFYSNYGNVASVIGLVVTAIAAVKASQSQKAAQEAKEAAKQSSLIVSTFLNLAEFDRLLTLVTHLIDYITETEELNKNHVRKSCEYIKNSLISMKSNITALTYTHHTKIQTFIHFLSECERIQIENKKTSHEEKNTIKTAINIELSKHKTAMQEVVAELRANTGEKL